MEGVYKKYTPSWKVYIFIYTLHFSLMHSQTVLGVLHAKCMLSVFFDLRCESVTYIYTYIRIYIYIYIYIYLYLHLSSGLIL